MIEKVVDGFFVTSHGGGWSMGAPEGAHVSILRLIAKTGVVCVNIEYRLAPEVSSLILLPVIEQSKLTGEKILTAL